MINNIVILANNREKKNSHITDYFVKNGIFYQSVTLNYGDYSFMIPSAVAGDDIYFHRDIVIERKASLGELSGNLAQRSWNASRKSF